MSGMDYLIAADVIGCLAVSAFVCWLASRGMK